MADYNFTTTIIWPPIPKQTPEVEEKLRAYMAEMLDKAMAQALGAVPNKMLVASYTDCNPDPRIRLCYCPGMLYGQHNPECSFNSIS